jgi:superkiller protein 3
MPFTFNGRFRSTIIPFLGLFAGFGLAGLLNALNQREYRRLFLASLAACGLYLLASIQWVAYEPDLALWHFRKATACVKKGDAPRAIAAYQAFLDSGRESVWVSKSQVQRELGTLLLETGKVKEGREFLQTAIRTDPDSRFARQAWADRLMAEGKPELALAEYRAALNIRSDYAPAALGAARAYMKIGQDNEAYDLIRPLISSDDPDVLNEAGLLFSEKGQGPEALACMEKAVRLRPDWLLARNNLGNALCDLGRHVEGWKQYEGILSKDPMDPHAKYNMANSLAVQGDLEKAVALYGEALTENPRNANIANNLGMALAKLERTAEAVNAYNTALTIEPGLVAASNNLGNIYDGMGNVEKAEQAYLRALRAEPENAHANYNLGILLARQNRLDEAYQHLKKAAGLLKGRVEALATLGQVCMRLGRLDESIGCFSEIVRLNPDSALARYQYGIVLESAGRMGEALSEYEAGLALAPEQSELKEKVVRLKSVRKS